MYEEPSDHTDSTDGVDKTELGRIVRGESAPRPSRRRVVVAMCAGLLVGLAEGGMPHSRLDWYRVVLLWVMRILTGAAVAQVPWRISAIYRGVIFSLATTAPVILLLHYQQVRYSYLHLAFLAIGAGAIIGYWTERFGTPRHHEE